MTNRPSRRRFLQAVSAGSLAGAAGCLGGLRSLDEEVPSLQADGVWPTFAADARNTGHADTTGPTDPEIAWEFETTGRIYDGATVVDETVYLGSTDGNVYALDADDGDEQWRFPVLGQVRTTPAVADGLVYAGGTRGGLYALDAVTGEKRWSTLETKQFSQSHPTVVDGTVYVGSREGELYGVDAQIGQVQGSIDIGQYVSTCPAISDGVIYVGWRGGSAPDANGGGLSAYTMDGERLWQASPGDVNGSPAVVDGTVYACTGTAAYAFDAETGEEQWRFEDSGGAGSPAVANGRVFVGSMESTFYALDAESGEKLWSFSPGKWPEYPAAVADGVVYMACWATRTYGLDAETGEKLWGRSLENPLSDPAVADGTMYIAANNRMLALRDA
ncbi:MAG: outer membrane protein assembly factor BamB [Natronomonas sp.]|jgi:outer membrane protein assembly factor BamB|uniref:outer membrane protein assembly factor BamB family protein n=1 Tax=Natronomonas sp. TaxID=2184060 RepID=UPI00398935B7